MNALKSILIPLTLIAAGTASAQTVTVSPTSLNLSALVGGNSVSQSLSVSITGSNNGFAVFPSQSWLTVNPTGGNAPAQVTVTANPAGLSIGTYNDNNFRIVTANQTITVPVTFTVAAITVSPQSLNFAYTAQSPNLPQGQTLTVSGQNLNYTISVTTQSGGNWLAATPNGSNQISVAANPLLGPLAAGTYQGTVTISQSGSAPINVPVTLTISPEPPVTVSPSTVNLYYQTGGQNNLGAQQPVTFSTASTVALPYMFGTPSVNPNPAGANWITVSPTSGTIPANGSAQSTIGYNTSTALPAGNYSGTVPVAATGGAVSSGILNVNLFVSDSPLLIVPTQALNFSYEIGGAQPASQTVTPQSTAVAATSNAGQMAISVSATTATGGNWLTVTPTASLNTGTPFTASVNPAGLSPATYNGTITVSPAPGVVAGNGAQTIAITLTVANDPSIQASVSAINIPYQVGQANTQAQAQTINLTSSTGAPLNYTVTSTETNCSSVNWLALSQTTGTTNGSFIFTPSNLSSLTAGTTCTGTITVTATNPASGNSAINSPLTIPVSIVVSNSPMLVASASSLTFSSPVSGSGGTQQITVTSTDPASTLTYSVSESTNNGNSSWLAVGPQSGSTSAGSNVISVSINPTLLSAGTYTGAVTITSAGTPNSPVTIPVTLQITSGTLSVSSASLSFPYTQGATTPAAQTVQVSGNGAVLNFTAAANSGNAGVNWLSVTPTSGTTPASLSISVSPGNLAPGTYTGMVVVTSPNAAGSPATIAVTLSVNSGTLTATPAPTSTGLVFTQQAGGSAPASQTIALAGSPGAINFTASGVTTSGGAWLTVTPASGTTPSTVTVAVNAGSLGIGSYNGTVTINAPGATGGQLTYPVTLNVVTPITITASPSALSFGYTLNTSAPAAQTVQIAATAPAGIGTLAMFPFTTSVATTDGGKWLSVTPTTGTVPGSISVSVNPQGLAVGNYTGTITVATGNSNGATPATITVKLAVSAAPIPVISAVVNAASYTAGALSPGEEVALFGMNFGPSSVVGATLTNNAFPTTLSNTQVLFDGVPAPIIAVTSGQVNVMVPYGVAGRSTTNVQVSYFGVSSAGVAYNVTSTVPGIYTVNQSGTGQGAILNQDYSGNGTNAPAAKGSVIAIYMTGEGVTSPPSITGQVAPLDGTGLNHPVQNVTVSIGGVNAPVQYYGSAPGLVYGVMQVNALVPSTVASGNQPIIVTVGNVSSQAGVTAAIK